MNDERYSFDENDSEPSNDPTGVKLTNSKSKFAKKIKQKEEFQKAADATISKKVDRNTQAAELVKQFWTLAKSETLEANKGPIEKNLEREIITKLIQFATELNNDENEPYGSGSVAIITLLLKIVIQLRNDNNQLKFKIAQIENKLSRGM